MSALIEAWGPDRIKDDFDMAIFVSHYGSIVSLFNFMTAERMATTIWALLSYTVSGNRQLLKYDGQVDARGVLTQCRGVSRGHC